MVIVKYICDFCRKEVELPSELEDLILDTRGGRDRHEVCRECFYKVRDYAYKLKQEGRARNEPNTKRD